MKNKPNVKYCNNCTNISRSAVPLEFDLNGICSGCKTNNEKVIINWDRRRKMFESLVEDYKSFIHGDYRFRKMDDMKFLNRLYQKFSHSITSHEEYNHSARGHDNNNNQYLDNGKSFPKNRITKEEGFVGEIWNEDETYEYQRGLL